MKNFSSSLLYLLLPAFLLAACTKEDKKGEDSPDDKAIQLTAKILEDKSQTAIRLWDVVDVRRIYYNAAGEIDSTVIPPITARQIVRFGGNDPNAAKKVYGIDYPDPPTLSLLIPEIGYWQLSADGKKITFTESYFKGGGPGGTFDVTLYETGDISKYKYGLDASITRSLPNGRKLVETFALGGD